MRILVWQVHGGWMNGFLRGHHEYLVPRPRDGSPAPDLPPNARAVPETELRSEQVDAVVLQRLEELGETEQLLGRTPGRDVPAVFVEHNTPQPSAFEQRHPLADQDSIAIVHVTHFNRLMWDSGRAPAVVIEHGVPDPGPLYTGEVEALGVVVNEPVRRGRAAGTDLLPYFAQRARLDVFGIDAQLLPGALGVGADRVRYAGNLAPHELHPELARRRAYLHPFRWTSLGLSLLEAMSLGMPVLALATTEAARAVPPEAGAISANPDELRETAALLLADPEEARARGALARRHALAHYGLERFLRDWDAVLATRVDAHRAIIARRTRATQLRSRWNEASSSAPSSEDSAAG